MSNYVGGKKDPRQKGRFLGKILKAAGCLVEGITGVVGGGVNSAVGGFAEGGSGLCNSPQPQVPAGTILPYPAPPPVTYGYPVGQGGYQNVNADAAAAGSGVAQGGYENANANAAAVGGGGASGYPYPTPYGYPVGGQGGFANAIAYGRK